MPNATVEDLSPTAQCPSKPFPRKQPARVTAPVALSPLLTWTDRAPLARVRAITSITRPQGLAPFAKPLQNAPPLPVECCTLLPWASRSVVCLVRPVAHRSYGLTVIGQADGSGTSRSPWASPGPAATVADGADRLCGAEPADRTLRRTSPAETADTDYSASPALFMEEASPKRCLARTGEQTRGPVSPYLAERIIHAITLAIRRPLQSFPWNGWCIETHPPAWPRG